MVHTNMSVHQGCTHQTVPSVSSIAPDVDVQGYFPLLVYLSFILSLSGEAKQCCYYYRNLLENVRLVTPHLSERKNGGTTATTKRD